MSLTQIDPACTYCGAVEADHEPGGCCGDGGGSTFAAQGIEAGTAETVKQGSVHESPVGNADAPE